MSIKMTIENGKIVKITENELFDLYLNRGMDDVMPFPYYKERFEKAGCVVETEEIIKKDIITEIEKICEAHDTNTNECLEKIKEAISSERKPDFSKIIDGEHFMYKGIEFIRLGKEQGGILCITAKVWEKLPFDKSGYNNYTKSSLRKELQQKFLPLLNEADLLPYEIDLTADNGDTTYGKCIDKVGLISCDIYRKYRNFIPLFYEWWWTCTAWHCISGHTSCVRTVTSSGTLSSNSACSARGVVPSCIFIENE